MNRTLRTAILSAFGIAACLAILWGLRWEKTPSRRGSATEASSPTAASEAAPEYRPPAVRDPALAAFVDRRADIADRIPGDITSRMPAVRPEDIPAIVSVLLDTKDDDAVRNEAVNLLGRSGHNGLADDLIRVLENTAEGARFRSFCVQHLGQVAEGTGPDEREKIAAVLRRALDDRDIPVRREALLTLVRFKDPVGRETAARWLTELPQPETGDGKQEAVLDMAIRCVHDLGLREYLPAIRKHADNSSEPVRIAAIVALSDWRDEESRSIFERAAASDSPRLQKAGQIAIRKLR